MFLNKASTQFYRPTPKRGFYDVEISHLPEEVITRIVEIHDVWTDSQRYLNQIYGMLRTGQGLRVLEVEVPECLKVTEEVVEEESLTPTEVGSSTTLDNSSSPESIASSTSESRSDSNSQEDEAVIAEPVEASKSSKRRGTRRTSS